MATFKMETNLNDIIVDVEQLGRPSVYSLVGDMWAIDKIATLLGTADDWRGADFLEMIADVIGIVRPHPGESDGEQYVVRFIDKTYRNIHPDFDQREQ